MKIAILGAPGSGKSAFATKLATALRAEEEKPKSQSVQIVDGYVENLTKQTGFAYGIHATFPQNFQILSERWTQEQKKLYALKDSTVPVHLITCGSIYDTILYTALRINSQAVLKRNKEAVLLGRVAMEALGMIEKETSDYDILFFLPYNKKKRDEKGRSYDTAINLKLPEVVAEYFKTLVPLEGTTKEKVKDALRAIDAYATWQATLPAVDEQPAV